MLSLFCPFLSVSLDLSHNLCNHLFVFSSHFYQLSMLFLFYFLLSFSLIPSNVILFFLYSPVKLHSLCFSGKEQIAFSYPGKSFQGCMTFQFSLRIRKSSPVRWLAMLGTGSINERSTSSRDKMHLISLPTSMATGWHEFYTVIFLFSLTLAFHTLTSHSLLSFYLWVRN